MTMLVGQRVVRYCTCPRYCTELPLTALYHIVLTVQYPKEVLYCTCTLQYPKARQPPDTDANDEWQA